MTVRLLVTRPQEDAEGTAAALRARGHEVLVAPLLRIENLSAELGTGPWAAVLLSSANGARAVAAHVRRDQMTRLPAFTVGRNSAEAARATGFAQVYAANGDADDLVALASARLAGSDLPLLYVAGETRSADIAGGLATRGLKVETVVGYRAVAARALPEPVAAAIAGGTLAGVLHFSPRSATIFVDLVKAAGLLDSALNCFHYCLSARVAASLRTAGATRIRIAPHPEERTLLDLIGSA
jgi:uroporphyrinogen-III synthase